MRLFPAFLLLYALENGEMHLEIIGRMLTVLNRSQGTRAITRSAAVEAGSHNFRGTGKVKVTLVQALMLCTGRTAHRGNRGIALLFHDHGTRNRWGFIFTHRPPFTPLEDPVSIVQEAGWAPGPVWTGAENLAPNGIRSPDRPARSQSLYWLCYPAHNWYIILIISSRLCIIITYLSE